MERQDGKPSDIFGVIKSWVRWRPESSANISTDFWMPDHSCRVCYECDAQFTVFNRRHHCRLCGRIFCAKCTANSVPACAVGASTVWNEWEKVRVCNYCFNQWELGVARFGNEQHDDISCAPSAASIVSTKSSESSNGSTISICSMSFGIFEQMSDNCSLSPYQSTMMDHQSVEIQGMEGSGINNISLPYAEKSSLNKFRSGTNSFRSDDEDDDIFGVVYQFGPKTRNYPQDDDFYGPVKIEGISNAYDSHTFVSDVDNVDTKSVTSFTLQDKYDEQDSELHQVGKKEDHNAGDECEALSSICAAEDVDTEPVDFENNGLFWLPPEPENEEDDRETSLFDDDDDDDGDDTGEWGRLQTSDSFGSGEFRSKDKSGEEQKKMMKNIVYGHFRALVSQLLQVENIPISDDDDDGKDSWLEIITALSWEAATLLKPDTSKGGGMDPGGYVKVKYIVSGCPSESVVIKGVVCKKNVAHRRMTSRIDKPRLMILGGALEYQRVSNHLSSFDTLLQQEMDHLKMAVAKIDAHRPNVLLVEKSVSRHAQEYILAKDISLVLNIKRPLLERIARCTGAQIVPSIDHLTTQKMGHCDLFHVDKCFESHGSAGQAGKKLTKTLMYFEGCPKPLGCTILLRGANGDELRKVKHVVQYGIFAAYHLAVETSFLADEGASLPEHLLSEPITVAFPNKSSMDQSISIVPGFIVPTYAKSFEDPQSAYAVDGALASGFASKQTDLPRSMSLPIVAADVDAGSSCFANKLLTNDLTSEILYDEVSCASAAKEKLIGDSMLQDGPATNNFEPCPQNYPQMDDSGSPQEREESLSENACRQDANTIQEMPRSTKEEFPPSPSDLQSILVSLSSRCVWKGTVCERSHLFRIKYYGSFDKPVGRFLQDHLFDQSYRCRTCDMPSEAHVQCYTHRQGTLTISVKKLSEILLPGEREGKIWMWHRCLRCPRLNGFPPATRRVVMSDAAWGLSFGKFLELSFSNHAAASRVASCGHSLHRDCLRFYGCGKMVACFRYASIDVYSVHLPPSKVEFNYEIQDWIQKEAKLVVRQAGLLFSEVLNAISQITEKKKGEAASNTGFMLPESRHHITDLKKILQNEKTEFEEIHWKALNREAKKGCPAIDILEINRLRRQLLFQSYMWDHRLVHADSLDKNSHHTDNAGSRLSSQERSISTSYFVLPIFSKISSNPPAADESFQPSSNLEGELKDDVKMQDSFHETVANSPDISSNKENQSDGSVFGEKSNSFECGSTVRRALSDSHFLNLSDTLDAAWTGNHQPGVGTLMGSISVDSSLASAAERFALESPVKERSDARLAPSPSPAPTLNLKGSDNTSDEAVSWLGMPFLNFYRSLNKNFLGNAQKLDTLGGYNPMYVSSAQELIFQGGAKWLLPVGFNDHVIPIYDDEPTSIISYALVSQDYHVQLSNDGERQRETLESAASLPLHESTSFISLDETMSEPHRSLSVDDSILSTSTLAQHLINSKSLHIRVSFTDNGSLDKVKYTVTCYYAKHFDALRKICCPSEVDYVRSLSRCKKWGAQGGKSNVFFAKTLDDRFIIKQVTKTELESFIKFAPEYFKYLTESISTKSPTCLAKILGIYQITIKHLKGGKDSKMDVLVMENLLFKRNVTRLYDLKGSSRSRYNPDSSGTNKVLLDQNLIEAMPTSPIFVGNKAKRLLERAVWNDTSFLASVHVMDYSLLVGVDGENHELVLGIIDFMRQYTWDKHLETWVKASGILGGPKNVSPTVISPKQYKKRFRKAMTTYFLMVPDQWSPPSIIPSKEKPNLSEENVQCISPSAE